MTSRRVFKFMQLKNKKAKSGIKLCSGISYRTASFAFRFLAARYQKNPITAAKIYGIAKR
jgi:hypothetical protein